MNIKLISAENLQCEPLTVNRHFRDCPVANIPFSKLLSSKIEKMGFIFADNATTAIRENAWISEKAYRELTMGKSITFQNEIIAGEYSKKTFKDSKSYYTDDDCFLIKYAWDFLKINEIIVSAYQKKEIFGEVSPAANIEGIVKIGEGTRILPGVFIEGNVVIGEHCKIGPNCYLRGNTAIGNHCHIGQSVEIKNSILMNGTSVGHLSYVGDSILGEKVNLGAGTITANLRHDNQNHKIFINNEKLDTGRRKFGIIVGDHVHTGINTSFYPARLISPEQTTLPGEIVRKNI